MLCKRLRFCIECVIITKNWISEREKSNRKRGTKTESNAVGWKRCTVLHIRRGVENRRRRKRVFYCWRKNDFCQYRSSTFRRFRAAFSRFLENFRVRAVFFQYIYREKSKLLERVDERRLNLDGLAKTVKICGLGATKREAKTGERGFSSAPALFEK